MAAHVEEVRVAADPAVWRELGFTVDDDGRCLLGSTPVRLVGEDPAGRGGIVGWSLSGLETDALDGLPADTTEPRTVKERGEHPNGTVSLDHLVIFTPNRDRTVAALKAAGFDLRREVEGVGPTRPMRFGFFRSRDLILEIAEPPDLVAKAPDRPARFWGLAAVVPDLDALAAQLGDALGAPRDAVQPGRRIASLRKESRVGVPFAFMTPGPGAIESDLSAG